jgi:hypothetical protein
MPITDQDIRLMASSGLDDSEYGGGPMSPNEVMDGVSNNLFPDISELDRTMGRVSLRKAFAAVTADNREAYYGSGAIIDQLPEDPLVGVALFSTRDWDDMRPAAQSRLEAYLARGPKFEAYFYDWHTAGQKAALLLAHPAIEMPAVGETLVILYDGGLVTQEEQFVRVLASESVVRDFVEQGGTAFQQQVITLTLSDPLERDINGGSPSLYGERGQTHSIMAQVHKTIVADAARYYGMTLLTSPAALGDMAVQVADIFTKIVPTSQAESAIADAKPHADSAPLAVCGAPVTLSWYGTWDATHPFYLGQGFLPGSLSVAVNGVTVTDRGGKLLVNGAEVGAADYAGGVLTLTASSLSGSHTADFTPAAAPSRSPRTRQIPVTPEGRSGTISTILVPPPAPGGCALHYMAQGKWYVLRDDGSGSLKGADTSFGAGSINYSSGSLVCTLGALPDVGSAILLVWGSAVTDVDRSGGSAPVGLAVQGSQPGGAPGTYTLTWSDGTATRTATDDGAGNLEGDAVGEVDYSANRVLWYPKYLPAGGAVLTLAYSHGTPLAASFASPGRNPDGTITLTLPDTQVLPGTVKVSWTVSHAPYGSRQLTARDDGVGGLVGVAGAVVNYAAGTVTFQPDASREVRTPVIEYANRTAQGDGGPVEYIEQNVVSYTAQNLLFTLSGTVGVAYRVSDGPQAASDTATISYLEADLTPEFAEAIVSGSARLNYGGEVLVERYGRLDMDIDHATGAGTQAGTLDRATGLARLTQWTPGAQTTGYAEVASLLTSLGVSPVDAVTARTAAAPIRPGSFLLVYQMEGDPEIYTAQSTTGGEISGDFVRGWIDSETGVWSVRFGEWVTPAGHEAEPWYDADLIEPDGKIRSPMQAVGDSLRYTAVAYSYLPLDASILGLNPVRLPSDGRVPILRPGDVAVVHHEATITVATPADDQVIDCGRVRLARVEVRDGDGAKVATAKWSADLDAGLVTLLDVAGLPIPWTVTHRVEDMALVSDAQISGQVTFTRPLSHDFPAGSGCSSELLFGDLQARVTPPFDQQTWTGVWSDTLIGNATGTASFNHAVYPITTTDRGAAQQRWMLLFTSPTMVRIVGETAGVVGEMPIADEIGPLNPATGAPYFVVDPLGWGTGWSTGNLLRFNTVAANYPVWVARTVQQGPAYAGSDSFRLQVRGDVDA